MIEHMSQRNQPASNPGNAIKIMWDESLLRTDRISVRVEHLSDLLTSIQYLEMKCMRI